ncbi:MAG: ShlB/FhaC/HecB family hemolysin secretion/activation protein [Pleurocapsa sp.]
MSIAATILTIVVETPSQAYSDRQFYLAQTPNPPLPDRQRNPQIEPLPPIEDFLESPPNQLPDSGSTESNVEFEVKQFNLEGNTVLEAEAIEAIFQDYRDRPITFADLLELETKLTRLYTDNGYINSAVIIPSQNISQGIVNITAIEGTVEEINVNVDGRLKESYIRSRLQRGTNTPLNINELQEALQLLQLNPLVENLNAELSVGLSRDRWMLDVDVNQGEAFDPVLFVNNYRTPSVGSFQRGLELNHNNVLGYGDRFSFIYKNTDGSNDFDTSYRIPVNSSDGTVGLRYRYVDSEIVEEEFESANIESETSEFELTLRQPLLIQANSESTQEFALGLEFSSQSNSTTIDIGNGREPFELFSDPAVRDEDDIGETRISAVRFFQDWTKRTRTDVIAARSQLSAGVDIFDATVNENQADLDFVSWRGQVQWLRQLSANSNINLLLRSDIQLSSSDLVPLEQFSLGGVESVRGYRQDALLSDSGIFASAEVRIPFYRWNNNQSNLSVVPFFDAGTRWNNSDDLNQDEDTLASLGVGLQLNLDDSLRARLDYGIPLVDVQDNDNTLQEKGLYLSLEYFPF